MHVYASRFMIYLEPRFLPFFCPIQTLRNLFILLQISRVVSDKNRNIKQSLLEVNT